MRDRQSIDQLKAAGRRFYLGSNIGEDELMKSAVTISLVPEALSGPFVFHGDLPGHIRDAAKLGFDAVEIFPPSADAISLDELQALLGETGLAVAAVGTGAGWLRHGLTLANADVAIRERARGFVEEIIDFAAQFRAPVIVGSMQGRWDAQSSKAVTIARLRHELGALGAYAQSMGTSLLYEPLNRYETNIANTCAEGVELIDGLNGVKLLADLFHMSIEEVDLVDAIRQAGAAIGHVHFADSNRRAAGMGHTEFWPIVESLRTSGYSGYLSAEVLPLPNTQDAAVQAIKGFHESKLVPIPF